MYSPLGGENPINWHFDTILWNKLQESPVPSIFIYILYVTAHVTQYQTLFRAWMVNFFGSRCHGTLNIEKAWRLPLHFFYILKHWKRHFPFFYRLAISEISYGYFYLIFSTGFRSSRAAFISSCRNIIRKNFHSFINSHIIMKIILCPWWFWQRCWCWCWWEYLD